MSNPDATTIVVSDDVHIVIPSCIPIEVNTAGDLSVVKIGATDICQAHGKDDLFEFVAAQCDRAKLKRFMSCGGNPLVADKARTVELNNPHRGTGRSTGCALLAIAEAILNPFKDIDVICHDDRGLFVEYAALSDLVRNFIRELGLENMCWYLFQDGVRVRYEPELAEGGEA